MKGDLKMKKLCVLLLALGLLFGAAAAEEAETVILLSDDGITVNGAKYLVGHTMTLEAGDAKIYCLITNISETAPDESKLAGVSIGAKAE